jgi:RNA-binding protein
MPILEITSRERSTLRSAAHSLRPVVLIGDKGLSDAVLKEIDLNLTSHGLIKVRAGGQERDARDEMLLALCDALSCAPVHHLGKMFILYRPQPGQKSLLAPAPAAADRPKRKPSEPHVPKKLAAQGKTLSKLPRGVRKTEAEPEAAARYERVELNSAGKPLRPSTRKSTSEGHGIPRRSGSALSLRAGARSGVQRGSRPARKTVKR